MCFHDLQERVAYHLYEPGDFIGRTTTTRDDWSYFDVIRVRTRYIVLEFVSFG
jgi:hypothetical protein